MLLEKEISELEAATAQASKLNTEISKSSVGWHVDHTLKAISSIHKSLKKSDPKDYKWRFNWIRSYILIRGSIPRGRGKAPKVSVAKEEIKVEDIHRQIATVREMLIEFEKMDAKVHFPHPYFGVLHHRHSRRFLEIHTEHHLKIIREILKS